MFIIYYTKLQNAQKLLYIFSLSVFSQYFTKKHYYFISTLFIQSKFLSTGISSTCILSHTVHRILYVRLEEGHGANVAAAVRARANTGAGNQLATPPAPHLSHGPRIDCHKGRKRSFFCIKKKGGRGERMSC